MYGFFLDAQACDYLVEVGEASREYAAHVLEHEREKQTELRIWHHKVLTELSMGLHAEVDVHRGGCLCPVHDYNLTVPIVRGCSRAIREYIDDYAEQEGTDPVLWSRESDPIDVAREFTKNQDLWPLLRRHLDDAMAEDGGLAQEQHDAFIKQMEDNEAGNF